MHLAKMNQGRVRLVVGLLIAAFVSTDGAMSFAQDLSAEEQREQLMAERFMTVLLRRPSRGTSLDRVFGYHIARGDIGEFISELESEAESATDTDESGRYWTVIGLLQMQRSEDAAAVRALANAEQRLPDNALAAYYHGQALLLIGRTEEAAGAMQRAIDLKPPRQEFLQIAGQLGRLYQRDGNVEQALGIWKQLEDAFPGDTSVRQRIARILLEEGDTQGALERFDALAQEARTPNDKIVFALRAAELRIRSGEKEKAITDLEQLLGRLRPGSYLHDEARRRIESAYLANADYAGLAEYYEGWLKDHPDDVGAIVRLARTLSVQGRAPEALSWFEKAIERAPSEPGPRIALVNAYVAAEKFADAAEQYKALVDLEPNNPDHFVRWGQVLLSVADKPKSERKADAAKVWNRLADARDEDAVVQSQVADLFRGAEMVDEALARYRKAIELSPDDSQYKEYLGEYLFRLDRKDEAYAVWKSLAEGELRTRPNLVRLAEVYNQFERPDEALETMAAACEMDPTIDERLRYAEWLRDDEQYDQAITQIDLAGKATESVDDRERVFAAEVKTYQASGQLADRIEQAEQDVQSDPDNGDLWRQLAVLHNAAGKTRDAFEAIEEALTRSPDSIEALVIAAQLYEDSGRLRLAIEKRKTLAEIDQRFRGGHLQKLATLQLQVGEADQAIETGRSLLAASAGSIESYRFYADLCGKIGRTDERLDTLRRCARLNPRSNEAQEMLAKQLAEDFKTDQAVELYWKMLDGTDDIEESRVIAQQLADLYLRTNRLDQLIGRLEIRGRESGDRRSTVDLIATVHTQVGDLGLARQTLESLLQESGRDTLLLERLVMLAEQSGEYDEAVRLQRQLTRLAPDRANESRLASLLIDVGATEEAQAIWMKLTESNRDPDQLARNIDRLFAAGEVESAIRLAENAVERDPDDWESQFRLMVLQAEKGDWEAASATGDVLANLDFDDDAPPPSETKNANRNRRTPPGYQPPPPEMNRVQNLYSFYRLVDDRYGYQSNTTLPKPIDFGYTKLIAKYCRLKQASDSGADLAEQLAELEEKALAEDASAELAWQWYEMSAMLESILQTQSVNWQHPESWKPLWRLAELDHKAGKTLLRQMLYTRTRYSNRSDIQLGKLPEERLDWLKTQAESESDADAAQSVYGTGIGWGQFYGNELRLVGRKDEADQYTKQLIADALASSDASASYQALQYAGQFATDEQLWPLIEAVLTQQPNPTAGRPQYTPASLLALFSNKQRVDEGLSKGADDPKYRERAFEIVDRMLSHEAEKPLRRRVIQLTGVGGPRSTYQIVSGNYQQVTIEFPPKGLGPDDQFVQSFYFAWKQLEDHVDDWVATLLQEPKGDEPSTRLIWRRVAAACLLQWEERTDDALAQLEKAQQIAAELPQLEPELRLMSADLLLRQNRKRDALDVIDSLAVYDQRTMALREFAAARLAAVIGDRDRAQVAAKRLFGVRLNTDAQIELAKLMRQLDMRALAADMVRRMQNRGGSSTDQLQSLMTYFVAQGEKDQAAQVAMDLLRRSAPSRRRSSQYQTSDQARRRSALQTLATTGRLTALIKSTEQRFENAPNSQRIRSELAELYEAAGQKSKSLELLGGTDIEKINSTQALEATAEQLVAAGKMDEACEAYLKYLRRNQRNFSQKFYDIKRPFDQQQRLDELAELMIEVGINKFTDHRVAEICSDLLREEKHIATAKKLYSAMLQTPSNQGNGIYSLSRIMGSSRKLLTSPEVVKETVDYLIEASGSGSTRQSLFGGYSTSSDGRHNNVTTYFVRYVVQEKENASIVESAIREELDDEEDWIEGKLFLGLLLAATERYDEASGLLKLSIEKTGTYTPQHDTLWLIGSLIDTHEPMHDLARQIYEYAIENTTDNSNREFRYSLKGRVCNFFADIGDNEKAREFALEAVKEIDSNSSRYQGNPEYEAYQKIQMTLGIMEFFAKIEFPADGLRVAREFDKSLFAKAGRYQRGRDQEFDKLEQQLLSEVRKLGGLETVKVMIDEWSTKPAVDFAITFAPRPFTETGLSSLWVDLLREVADDPEAKDPFEKLITDLKAMQEKRPDDDSVFAAHAIASHLAGDGESLRSLIKRWVDESEDEVSKTNPRLRGRLLLVAVLESAAASEFDAAEPAVAGIPLERIRAAAKGSAPEFTCFLGRLGKLALESGNREATESIWQMAIDLKASQWYLFDLSEAAVGADMTKLCSDAFAAAIGAPTGSDIESVAAQPAAGSLGQLLGSARRSTTVTSRSNTDQLDPEEVRIAQRVLELDQAWRKKKLTTNHVYDSLVALTIPDGRSPRPLCTPHEIKTDDRIVVDSVFDRLALRAHWSKRTDKLLTHLTNDDATTHVLAAIVLLRGERGEEAAEHLNAIDPVGFAAIEKELVLHALQLALGDATCREVAMRLSLALIDQNRPEQRYANVQPFDTYSLHLAKVALNNAMDEDFVARSLTSYLDLTAHDNDRYSGSSSRLTRRVDQLQKVGQILLPKGRIDQTLNFLAMRRAAFDQGFDRGNDWVGSWALESINGMEDRKTAYEKLVAWTFEGDGPLNSIRCLSRRQPLPEWIPASKAGHYPRFAPVADANLPIATNYFFLAKLAEQAETTEDLLARCELAHQADRGDADVALAIVLAALDKPVPPELLDEIKTRLTALRPADGKSKTIAPLPAVQLATLIDDDPAHSEFAKFVAEEFVHHTNGQSRGFLMPWLARYQHAKGWSETSDWNTSDRLEHWLPSTLTHAKDYSEGKPPAIWATDGERQVAHITGFGGNYLWFRYPLKGKFDFEVEIKDGGWAEAELVADGVRFAPLGNSECVYLRAPSSEDWIRYPSKAVKKNEWNRCTVSLDDKFLSFSVNGTLIYREKRTNSSPWIGIYSDGTKRTKVRHLKIGGDPEILREVDLIPESGLRGWARTYYNLALPAAGLNLTQREKAADEPRRYRSPPSVGAMNSLAWTVKGSELVSGKVERKGYQGQSVIQYARPLGDGETIEYEFYYEEGKSEVHPSIGRVAYLLRPQGCHLHWMSAGSTSWSIPEDFEVPVPGIEPSPLSLQSGEWNKVVIARDGDRITIRINDQVAFDGRPQTRLGDMVFGLYHNAKQTEARVRNVKLRGPWPAEIPESLF